MPLLSIRSHRKTLLLIALAVSALVLWAGLTSSVPANAQDPQDTPQPIDLSSPNSVPAPKIEYEAIPPAADPASAENTGYLHIHVYDWITGRPIGNRVITVYDRDNEEVTQLTTTCQGYVALPELPVGPYRVLLDADPEWVTHRRAHFPGGRNTPAEWVWVGSYWRVGVQFYEIPNVTNAGLRIEAYHPDSRRANETREPVVGAAFTVYDAAGNFVDSGTTGCGGLLDFNHLSPGRYRVADANEATGAYRYPASGEKWVSIRRGFLTSTWFFTVPSPGPQATPTPTP